MGGERGFCFLPADPLVVAHYVTEAAAEMTGVGLWRYAPATLTRWVSSINQFHTAAGLDAPGRSEVVRRALSGIRRTSPATPTAPPVTRQGMSTPTSLSPATVRAYAGDWALFTDWRRTTGESELPADPDTALSFLTDCPAAAATQRRRVAAIDHHRGSVDPAAKPVRRSFTAAYRARVVAEYAAAPHGEKSAVLRREGLYQSQIREWTDARDAVASQVPATVIHQLLGVSIATATFWTSQTGSSWSGYAAQVQHRGGRGIE